MTTQLPAEIVAGITEKISAQYERGELPKITPETAAAINAAWGDDAPWKRRRRTSSAKIIRRSR